MNFAFPLQKLQDWLTQQWVIFTGRKINPKDNSWLIGPFGDIGSISDEFIIQLAKKENLIINRDTNSQGLIPSIKLLNLSESESKRLSEKVIDFYEKTSDYKLGFEVKWNTFFKLFGILLNNLFSKRIGQLNIPTKNTKESLDVNSEIITLSDSINNEIKYTIWFRTLKSNDQIIFSGVYSTCTIPSGKKCIKAVFPLPKGNATVIMSPSVGVNGQLILDSFGQKFNDPGFYFLLQDIKGNYWGKNHRSFRDKLIVSENKNGLSAEHTQTLWSQKVLQFNYQIKNKN